MPRERPNLTYNLIVDEALDLLDAEGLEGFSMRKLAARLGVEAMSIYHHLPNRQAILVAVADRIVGEIRLPMSDSPWRMRLGQFAEDAYRVFMAHPAMVTILATEIADPTDPQSLAPVDSIMATLEGAGFTPVERVTIFHALTSIVFGFVLMYSQGIVRSGRWNADDRSDPAKAIRAHATEVPHIAALLPAFAATPPGDDFRLALRLFLDGLEREHRGGGSASA
ncbi:MAG: TetR/AcrR family transcriptional regulator C-terminal domain-containing protein [Thermomicrobiales bacterium]